MFLLEMNVYLPLTGPIRTADPHIIYDIHRKRINPSKSVFIGDHVWCGQNVLLLKGCRVGSGVSVK